MHWWAVWKIFAIHTTYISEKVLRPSFTNIKEKSSTWFLLFLYHWDCWCQKWRQWLWGIVCGCLVKDGRVIPPSLPRLMLHFPWLIDHKVSQQNAAAAHSVQLHTIHTLDIQHLQISDRYLTMLISTWLLLFLTSSVWSVTCPNVRAVVKVWPSSQSHSEHAAAATWNVARWGRRAACC